MLTKLRLSSMISSIIRFYFNNKGDHNLLCVLMFLATLSYNIVRSMKEDVLINLPGLSASYIPVVNLFVVLPLSFLLGGVYMNRLKRHHTAHAFHCLCFCLIGYQTLYTWLLSSHIDLLTPPDHLGQDVLLLRPFIQLIKSWPGILYYASCELWGNFSLLVLFWQLANDNYTTEQAKTAYPLFLMISSFGIFCASFLVKYIHQTPHHLTSSWLIMVVIVALMMGIVSSLKQSSRKMKEHTHTSTWLDDMKDLLSRPNIMHLALSIIIFYTLTNILEVTVKEMVGKTQYLSFMSHYLFYQGITLMITNLIGFRILRLLGWSIASMITPFTCILTTNIFLFYRCGLLSSPFEMTAEHTMYYGIVAVIIVQTAKYSFFDATKEMFYIPMSVELRSKGKTLVDGVGTRVGKSAYGIVQFALFFITGMDNMQAFLPYLAYLVVGLSLLWLWSSACLQKHYHASLASSNLPEQSHETYAHTTSG